MKTETVLLLGAVGFGIYGYYAGWFQQYGFGPVQSIALALPAGSIPISAAQAAQYGLPVGTTYVTVPWLTAYNSTHMVNVP